MLRSEDEHLGTDHWTSRGGNKDGSMQTFHVIDEMNLIGPKEWCSNQVWHHVWCNQWFKHSNIINDMNVPIVPWVDSRRFFLLGAGSAIWMDWRTMGSIQCLVSWQHLPWGFSMASSLVAFCGHKRTSIVVFLEFNRNLSLLVKIFFKGASIWIILRLQGNSNRMPPAVVAECHRPFRKPHRRSHGFCFFSQTWTIMDWCLPGMKMFANYPLEMFENARSNAWGGVRIPVPSWVLSSERHQLVTFTFFVWFLKGKQ